MKAAKFLPLVGQAVVMRGLCSDARNPTSTQLPPRVGIVVRYVGKLQIAVRLHMGHLSFGRRARKWCPRSRVVSLARVERAATEREIAVGLVGVDVGAPVRTFTPAEVAELNIRRAS